MAPTLTHCYHHYCQPYAFYSHIEMGRDIFFIIIKYKWKKTTEDVYLNRSSSSCNVFNVFWLSKRKRERKLSSKKKDWMGCTLSFIYSLLMLSLLNNQKKSILTSFELIFRMQTSPTLNWKENDLKFKSECIVLLLLVSFFGEYIEHLFFFIKYSNHRTSPMSNLMHNKGWNVNSNNNKNWMRRRIKHI